MENEWTDTLAAAGPELIWAALLQLAELLARTDPTPARVDAQLARLRAVLLHEDEAREAQRVLLG